MARGAMIGAAVAVVLGAVLAPTAASADEVTIAAGSDVSYPQCGRALPAPDDVAVVGVNAGTGTTTNPCLGEQLAWGDGDAAGAGSRPADVYVNTANPGHLGGWWPTADLTREGLPLTGRYGSCRGAEDTACGYVYGWSIAVDDLRTRGVSRPTERRWWLDVETVNSWSWDRSSNLAVLEGMTDALRQAGADVGVYSTERQWTLIVGRVLPTSSLAGMPSWIAGATSRAGAEADCAVAPFTPGGTTELAQWVAGDLDHDVACTPGVSGTTPVVGGAAVVGGVLVADPGRWGPAGVDIAVQWLRDGRPVPGAAGTVYALGPDDLGSRFAVRVGGSRSGAPDLALTSEPVLVGAAGTTPGSAGPEPLRPDRGGPFGF